MSEDQLQLVPARMVNEYVYCPRLAYLEWVQGEWADSAETVEGHYVHRKVDKKNGHLQNAEEIQEQSHIHATSVTLSSERLGVIARCDLVESDGGSVIPIDYKRGNRPHIDRGAYQPDRVQVCLQGLLLQEHGYQCDHGIIYYVSSRERVKIQFDEELITETHQ